MQHRDDALAVMPVGRRDGDRQREAVFIDRKMDLDAFDLLTAIEAAVETSRCRTTRAAVDDDGAGIGSIAASLPAPIRLMAAAVPTPAARSDVGNSSLG